MRFTEYLISWLNENGIILCNWELAIICGSYF
jgi:hypothetical protein